MNGIKHGQGPITLKKEAAIQTCLRYVLKVTRPRQYFVFDINCGSGDNCRNGANCRGTGLLAMDSMREYKIPGYMWLCDIDRTSLLMARYQFVNPQRHLWNKPNHRDGIISAFIHMDDREFVPTIPQRIRETGTNPKTARGIIIADPNGLKVPLKEIGNCIAECPLLDVVIHLSAVKQVWSFASKHPGSPQANLSEKVVRSCSQIFATIPRAAWLMSEPIRPGRDHYLFFGTSIRWIKPIIDLPGRPNMYRTDSLQGRALIADTDRYAEVS